MDNKKRIAANRLLREKAILKGKLDWNIKETNRLDAMYDVEPNARNQIILGIETRKGQGLVSVQKTELLKKYSAPVIARLTGLESYNVNYLEKVFNKAAL